MSSVLSYNDLNLAPVLEDREETNDENLHEPTFLKQFFYFLLMTFMNVGYTNLYGLIINH